MEAAGACAAGAGDSKGAGAYTLSSSSNHETDAILQLDRVFFVI